MARTLTPPPSHLTPVALALLLWQGLLAADYLITRFGLGQDGWPALMALMPMDALWLRVAWGLGVWLGFGAALFLVLRDNASVLLFFAGAVGFAAAGIGMILAAPPVLMLPLPLPAIVVTLVLLPLAGWLYARGLNKRGVLR
jgi:hypothetical protein